jgi:RimJ/RimL family protein N-acetyltransferase
MEKDGVGEITLRKMTSADIALCYEHQLDPEAGRMAAFLSKDGKDKTAYTARWTKLLDGGEVIARMIVRDGAVVGSIGSWGPSDERNITYWIWKEHWGKGIATAALSAFLSVERTRPLFGSAAFDNYGSIRVLEKCGFTLHRKERGFAIGRCEEIDEVVMRLSR